MWIKHWLAKATDEQLRDVCRDWDGEQFKFDERSYQCWTKVRAVHANKPVNTCEIVYICRDSLDRKSHFISLTKDDRVALLNDQYVSPIYLPHDPAQVVAHYTDINNALAQFEQRLDSARQKGVTDLTVSKFQDLVRDCAPADDFTLEYDDARLNAIYKAGLMTRTDEKAFSAGNKLSGKYWDRQCEYCDHALFCKGTGFNK
jgi:hypothetical protein